VVSRLNRPTYSTRASASRRQPNRKRDKIAIGWPETVQRRRPFRRHLRRRSFWRDSASRSPPSLSSRRSLDLSASPSRCDGTLGPVRSSRYTPQFRPARTPSATPKPSQNGTVRKGLLRTNWDKMAQFPAVARTLLRGRAGQSHPKPPQSHILGIDSGVQRHLKATPRPHQSHPKAPPRLHQGSTKATHEPRSCELDGRWLTRQKWCSLTRT
jgi:hypothetical protein